MRILQDTHDLRLPDWGPYSKKYVGISHLAAPKQGLRFDLSIFPGFYRRKVDIPSVLWESGYHPWQASADLNFFTHRHELEWKDRVFCDVSFAKTGRDGDNSRHFRARCVNATDGPQNLVLHLMASLQTPSFAAATPSLPRGALWIDALDYQALDFAQFRPNDHLVPDLLLRGEQRRGGAVGASVLGRNFGAMAGSVATYRVEIAQSLPSAALLLRFRAPQGASAKFELGGLLAQTIELQGSGDFALLSVPVEAIEAGSHELKLISRGEGIQAGEVELDGFVICESEWAPKVGFSLPEARNYPTLTRSAAPNSLLIQYPNLAHCYGLRWDFGAFAIREFKCDDLDVTMRHLVHSHTTRVFEGAGDGHFTDIYLHPVPLAPQSQTEVFGLICQGTRAQVEAILGGFAPDATTFLEAEKTVAAPQSSSDGQKFEFSQQLMRATLLTNVVYPAYARRGFIRHNTPGRWWDSLYTWDSGFIGLGLLELDESRAVDCLNAYVTEPGDLHAAYTQHGSPVPTQHPLFLELWNRTQSRPLLEHFYPRLKQFYRFLAGHDARARTDAHASNLLHTWDYFYNSGGWDDYPPQVHVHARGLKGSVTPVTTTAQVTRVAKILQLAARELGEDNDVANYRADIARFGNALNGTWDDEAGYFSYAEHDEKGQISGFLRHESGANLNMGLDGASPLLAGVCDANQTQKLVAHLFDESELWTPIGLSTVDQSAPYYLTNGYWNGAVWMPHQWFFWKALLDLGEGERAWQIARTGLETWKAEVDNSYSCFEHFIVQSGRGAGWHQFGGLSTPVLGWFASYFTPGTLTGGLDVWVKNRTWAADFSSLRASVVQNEAGPKTFDLVAAMNPNHRYRARWNGEEIGVREWHAGALQLHFEHAAPDGELEIERAN